VLKYEPYIKQNNGRKFPVLNAIKVTLSRQDIIGAVKAMSKKNRDDFLEESGLKVIRFSDSEVCRNLRGVIEKIWSYL